ncbi:hypothetical protein BDN71DRAFT_1435971 [Pleurotus eryngii]|uniref:Uncharacterized protein n=1 Tax=Pleurotus eryngii TaxID=5323 RepID=A0A9P5ZI32_PLEER|nr:hypothetical protein BDN71DRAFT_1435971 [Pleurotus eryngii]
MSLDLNLLNDNFKMFNGVLVLSSRRSSHGIAASPMSLTHPVHPVNDFLSNRPRTTPSNHATRTNPTQTSRFYVHPCRIRGSCIPTLHVRTPRRLVHFLMLQSAIIVLMCRLKRRSRLLGKHDYRVCHTLARDVDPHLTNGQGNVSHPISQAFFKAAPRFRALDEGQGRAASPLTYCTCSLHGVINSTAYDIDFIKTFHFHARRLYNIHSKSIADYTNMPHEQKTNGFVSYALSTAPSTTSRTRGVQQVPLDPMGKTIQ